MSFLSHRNRRSIGKHQDAQRQGMHLSIVAIVEQAAELVTCVLGRLTPVRQSEFGQVTMSSSGFPSGRLFAIGHDSPARLHSER
jgi:hypothetical protein